MLIKNKDDLLDFVGIVQAALEKGQLVELDYAIQGEKRTLEQNKKSWAMYKDIAKQCVWEGNELHYEVWKSIYNVEYERTTLSEKEFSESFIRGFNNVPIWIGQPTSKYPKDKFSDYIELIYAQGVECNVRWSITSEEIFKSYGITVE